jgi:hypothetical protein
LEKARELAAEKLSAEGICKEQLASKPPVDAEDLVLTIWYARELKKVFLDDVLIAVLADALRDYMYPPSVRYVT